MTMTDAPLLPPRVWHLDADDCYWIAGAHCRIWMQARPSYCDRGNWLAHLDVIPGTHPRALHVNGADGWPRYYFDLERAKAECEAWLLKRGEVR